MAERPTAQGGRSAVEAPPRPAPKTALGSVAALATALVAALYLLNLGFGWLELLPDNVPLVGNLDEAGATAALLGALRYLRRPSR